MKLKNMIKIFYIVAITLIISGCGGGSSNTSSVVDDGSTTPDNTTQPVETIVVGGTADAPSILSVKDKNAISINSSKNFFKYTGIQDEILLLHATLDNELTRDQKIDCQMHGDTFIAVYDENHNWMDEFKTCDVNLGIKLPVDGTYIIQFRYPENTGYVEVDSITSISDFIDSLPILSLNSKNVITANKYRNFFKYTGIQDEKLIIHATLDNELTRDQKIDCQMQSCTFIAIYDENLHWMDEFKTYTEDLTTVFPVDGTYIIQFRYPDNSGYAEAASIKP